jgi:hypothetical protein
MRQRQHWTPKAESAKLLDHIHDVIHDDDFRPHWPLSLRQVYYALVSDGSIENDPREYKKLVTLLAKGRLSGRIPWKALEDRHREVHSAHGYESADSFIESETENFLSGYSRDLMLGQTNALEVWVEKDALSRVVAEPAYEYCVPTVVAKGYASVSFVNDLRNRIEQNRREGKVTKILYFGDLDPSGMNMLPAMFMTLYEEMGVSQRIATYERCALSPEQVKKYKLPKNPDALKDDDWQRRRGDPNKTKGDPRAEAYKDEYGTLAVELDALRIPILQDLVRKAILRNIDEDVFAAQAEQEEHDKERIDKLRSKVVK